ncbi:MAG: hypothetical protein H0W33_03580 [Gammaproteobacteria bacterium]|nr:hypothetical protein [Gammaproteobacteria bacterium]
MPLIVRDSGGGDFTPLAEGVHVAVCNLVCDCGIQPGGRFKARSKLYIRWEVPGERISWTGADMNEHQGPAQIGKFYTSSLSQKAKLRRDLEAWRGRAFSAEELAGFDVLQILGAACQLMVTHSTGADGRVYANLNGVMGLPRGVTRPKAERALVKYSPDERALFDELPEWLQQKVRDGQAAPPDPARSVGLDDFDDDIPF